MHIVQVEPSCVQSEHMIFRPKQLTQSRKAAKKAHQSFAPSRLCVRFECWFSAEMAIIIVVGSEIGRTVSFIGRNAV
jgi:hypothetical protein